MVIDYIEKQKQKEEQISSEEEDNDDLAAYRKFDKQYERHIDYKIDQYYKLIEKLRYKNAEKNDLLEKA